MYIIQIFPTQLVERLWLTVDASGWIILDAQINVLVDPKTKIAGVREVPPQQLILLHLQASLLQKTSWNQ
jgi:hypothetical protein